LSFERIGPSGVASDLLVVGLLRWPVTIDDHAAARGWSRRA
jgi:hypothetical protein